MTDRGRNIKPETDRDIDTERVREFVSELVG